MIPDAAPGRERPTSTRSWRRSSTSCGRAARSASCHTTSPPGRRSTTVCACSRGARGQVSTLRWSWPTASGTVATPRPPPPSSTARPSGRRINQAIGRLWWGATVGPLGPRKRSGRKADQWAQAAHPDRYRRPPPRAPGPCRHRAGSRRRQGRAEAVVRPLPLRREGLRRRRPSGRFARWAQDKTHIALEIVKRPAGAKGFVVIQRRWFVERTLAWIMMYRRLVRGHEQLTTVAETLITLTAITTLVGRAA